MLRPAVVVEVDEPVPAQADHRRPFHPGLRERFRLGLPRPGRIGGPGQPQVLLQRLAPLVLEHHQPAAARADDGRIDHVEAGVEEQLRRGEGLEIPRAHRPDAVVVALIAAGFALRKAARNGARPEHDPLFLFRMPYGLRRPRVARSFQRNRNPPLPAPADQIRRRGVADGERAVLRRARPAGGPQQVPAAVGAAHEERVAHQHAGDLRLDHRPAAAHRRPAVAVLGKREIDARLAIAAEGGEQQRIGR